MQESETAQAARFQVTVASPASDGGVTISMMAFDLNAKTILTQFLFVKYRSLDVELWHSSGKVSVDAKVLASAGPAVAKKVADYVQLPLIERPVTPMNAGLKEWKLACAKTAQRSAVNDWARKPDPVTPAAAMALSK